MAAAGGDGRLRSPEEEAPFRLFEHRYVVEGVSDGADAIAQRGEGSDGGSLRVGDPRLPSEHQLSLAEDETVAEHRVEIEAARGFPHEEIEAVRHDGEAGILPRIRSRKALAPGRGSIRARTGAMSPQARPAASIEPSLCLMRMP